MSNIINMLPSREAVVSRIRDQWSGKYINMAPGRGHTNIYAAWSEYTFSLLGGRLYNPDDGRYSLTNCFHFEDYTPTDASALGWLPKGGALGEWDNIPEFLKFGGEPQLGSFVFWFNPKPIPSRSLYDRGFRYVNGTTTFLMLNASLRYYRQVSAIKSFDTDWYWLTSDQLQTDKYRNGTPNNQPSVGWVKVSGKTLRALGYKLIGWTPTLDSGNTLLSGFNIQLLDYPAANEIPTTAPTHKVNVRPQ